MKYLTLLLLFFWASLAQSVEFVTYYGHDQIGNPVAAIDRNQGVIATRDTVAYGHTQQHTGNQAAFGDLGFTGQIDRSNNQIVYFKARYYLPELRRFASPDPVTVVEGDYKHIDRYGYGYGNPVNANDPTGNVAETPWDIANAVIGWGTFGFDVAAGNWWGAAESGAGALYDTASIFVPGLPAGASTAIKGKRAAGLVADAVSDATKGGRNLPFKDKDRVTEINKTLDRIEGDGPFPHKRDGITFKNREGNLPEGNYLEYTVDTPGASNRGARRIVRDQDTDKTYYTDDHYQNFIQINTAKD